MGNKTGQVIALVCGCIAVAAIGCQTGEKTSEAALGENAVETKNTSTAVLSKLRLTEWDGPDSVEELLTYEVRAEEGREYVLLTGIKEKYRKDFARYAFAELHYWPGFTMPDKINGIWVEEIAEDAFQNLGTKLGMIYLPRHLKRVGDRAFADNPSLWAVDFPTADCIIGEDAFAGCEEKIYLGYQEWPKAGRNLVEEYAAANGLQAIWVPIIDSLEPVVRYPREPLVLTPEIGNYFYGDNAEGDDWLSCEEADDAPDYGFDTWHEICGEWCAYEGFLEITASSELDSSDDRYAARNLGALCGRECAWAEGAEGSGIGESITYHACNDWRVRNHWDYIKYEEWYLENENRINPLDGYIRYTQICIVNGYAKNQKTWEENGRVKTLLMYVEDQPYAYLELEDTIKPQYFTLPWEDIMVAERGDITFRFVIEDVYPGTTYEDTCLTGLVMEFTGRHGH